ncbi:MAG: DUF7844 domain-containing protein [Pseudobdellovibrionaceae bacterium]
MSHYQKILPLMLVAVFIRPCSAFSELISGVNFATQEQQKNLLKAEEEVEKLMPPQMFHYLKVQQSKPGNNGQYRIDLDDRDEHFAGASSKQKIILNRRIVSEPLLLRQTLIHEWAHIYDHLNLHSRDVANNIQKCAEIAESSANGMTPLYCNLYNEIKTTVSTMPRFLDIIGLFRNPNGVGRLGETAFTLRSPDIYEIQNTYEAFAVNMEYFLTDPNYKCRRPTLYDFLKNHFRFEPYPSVVCNSPLRILNASFSSASKALPVIDPSRVYQIHYLLADRGSGLSSTFGHSMFRLIICSPQRKEVGPECLKDIQSHVVLSFRAFVDTPDIRNIAGLSGQYPSRLFFIPFLQVVSEYNKTEERDLFSYPISFSEEEKNAFIKRSVEIHWSYNGNYKFVTNNCAIESMNLLRSVVKDENFLVETALTPFSLLDILDDYKLVNLDIMKDRSEAVKRGYLFESYEENYNKALKTIVDITNGYVDYDIKQWVELAPKERTTLFNRWIPLSDKVKRIKFIAAFLLLEYQSERIFNDNIQGYLLNVNSNSSSEDKNIAQLMRRALELNSSYMKIKETLVTPSQTIKFGYGIPSDEDLSLIKDSLERIAKEKVENSEQLDQLLSQIFNANRFQGLLQIRQNISLFSKALSKYP